MVSSLVAIAALLLSAWTLEVSLVLLSPRLFIARPEAIYA